MTREEAIAQIKTWDFLNDKEKEVLGILVPELKESEDEKIRKTLLESFEYQIKESHPDKEWLCGVKLKEIVAWLEKQNHDGKKWIYEDVYLKEKEQLIQDGIDEVLENPQKYGLEKQGEQKPVDKIEPKFNVRDWVIFNEHHDSVFQVEKIQGLRYYLRHYMGGSMSVHIDNQLLRHWTIEDAKDGDVLVEDSCIFIIQKLGDNSTAAKTYCTLYNDGDFEDGSILYFDIDSTKPATKAQRDTFFAKMKEAGYEWDAEKKELRKIENSNSADVVNDLPKLTDEDIDNLNKVQSWYRCERVISAAEAEKLCDWIKSFYDKLSLFQKMRKKEIKKTSEWTEEDEELYQDALDAFEALANDLNPSEDWGKLYDWLKSLKQRL